MDSPFEVLSRAITVRDLSKPLLGRFDISESVADVNQTWIEESDERGENPFDQAALAIDKGRVVGWLDFSMLMADKMVGECFESIAHESVLAADTPVIEAAKAFTANTQPFFFVLEENALTGWLAYSDLYKLPFRLCLFSLLLGVEHLASDLCKTQLGASLDALPPMRLVKAKKTYLDRKLQYDSRGDEYPSDLLDCTMFVDKIKILRKVFMQTVPASKDRLFSLAEDIRNDLAHPRDESVLAAKLERKDLLPLIDWSEKIQRQMKQVLKDR